MFLIIFLIFVILLFIYDRKNKNYWLEKGVFSPPCQFVFGSMLNIFSSTPLWNIHDTIYKKYKPYKMIGLYEGFNPKLFVMDPALIKNILVKDFDHFTDRRTFGNKHPKDILSRLMLVHLTGKRWKAVRSVTTTAFSSGKMKAMFPLIEKEVQSLIDFCRSQVQDGKSINMMAVSGKYSLNVIQSCAFGMEGESFKKKPTKMFHLIKDIFHFSYVSMLKFVFLIVSPKVFNFLGIRMSTAGQEELTGYMKSILADRRKNSNPRKDFLCCMIESEKDEKLDKEVIDDDVIVAQAALFLAAGFETVKNNLSFIIYNIAKYPEEQEKLREEMKHVENRDGTDYQKLQELHYLDSFISETMRIYPSVYLLERSCTKDYNIPNTDLTIPKDMIVTIPTYSLHYDPEFWNKPEEFQPYRFMKENKNLINNYAYLPFGLGPRNCLGNRFALLEIKMVIAKLLLSFDIKLLKPETALNTTTTIFAYKPDEDNGVNVILNEL